MNEPLPERITVLLVDDHPMVIEGVKALLRGHDDIEVVATAHDGHQALRVLSETPGVRVAIVDLNLPGMSGVELIRVMHSAHPDIRTVALSMYHDYSSITDVLEAGGSGYLLKNTDRAELVDCIRQVVVGRTAFSPEVAATLLQNVHRPAAAPAEPRDDKSADLTSREREVLQLIAQEYSNSLIAEKLFISERTVETHRKNIFTKTHSKSVIGLIQYALRHKLIG